MHYACTMQLRQRWEGRKAKEITDYCLQLMRKAGETEDKLSSLAPRISVARRFRHCALRRLQPRRTAEVNAPRLEPRVPIYWFEKWVAFTRL